MAFACAVLAWRPRSRPRLGARGVSGVSGRIDAYKHYYGKLKNQELLHATVMVFWHVLAEGKVGGVGDNKCQLLLAIIHPSRILQSPPCFRGNTKRQASFAWSWQAWQKCACEKMCTYNLQPKSLKTIYLFRSHR